jgi:DUF1707 SHOCT-like domain
MISARHRKPANEHARHRWQDAAPARAAAASQNRPQLPRRDTRRTVLAHRPQVLRRIVAAAADGRLEPGELAARSQAAQQAGSLDELRRVIEDLPGPDRAAVAGRRRRARRLIAGVLGLAGRWPIPALDRRAVVAAAAGEVVIDLRHTAVTSFTTTIIAVALAGEVRIIIPPGFRARTSSAITILGRTVAAVPPAPASALAPTITIRSTAVLGNVLISAAPAAQD